MSTGIALTPIAIDMEKVQRTTLFLASQPPLEPHAASRMRPATLVAADTDTAPITFQDDVKDAWTSGSGSLVFADQFKGGVKSNILYSWEYAQRWANKQIHTKYGMTDPSQQNADTIFTHAQEWYGFFKDMLTKLHWIVADFDFTNKEVSGDTFTVDKEMLELLTAMLTDDPIAMGAINSAMSLLKGLGESDSRMVLWDSHSNSQGKGSFQMGAVRDGGSGLAVMKTGALQMNSTQTTTTAFFFFHYSSSDTQLTKSSINLIFHDDAYTAVDASGRSAKSLVESAVVTTSNNFITNDGGIE